MTAPRSPRTRSTTAKHRGSEETTTPSTRAAERAHTRKASRAATRSTPPAPGASQDADAALKYAGSAETPTPQAPTLLREDCRISRIPATEVWPSIEDGRWPAKAVVNESFPVRATVFREGHDAFAAEAVLYDPAGQEVQRSLMRDIAPGLDRYEARLRAGEQGLWSFAISTWSDPFATWSHDASVKIAAGIDSDLMLEEGALLMERAAASLSVTGTEADEAREVLTQAAIGLRDASASAQTRLSAGVHQQVRRVMRRFPLRDLEETTKRYPVYVDRERALVGSWYEIFPRSIGAHRNESGEWTSGTLRSAAGDLERIRNMGFDVIYLTPIHPIGTTMRKGKNNSLTAAPGEPGSPYGIGAPEGGHDAIHPDLGTFADFDAFVERAQGLGMEVALDIALQCSPDHPWVSEHPEWFTKRSDGSIAYAENPPKKYQDIYPLNFDNDYAGLYQAIVDVIELWIAHGVTIFRVDNPHTKPLRFWQEFLAQMRRDHPDVLFLAEAFTRPAMMRTLGAVGFHQSYTYFAWRTHKQEIEDYLTEVARDTAHLMRPAFWPTTHDILTSQMVDGGEAAFRLRAVLAATGAPTWGIYSGYELAENVQRPGFEEQNDNEKYEYRPRDYASGCGPEMSRLLTALNEARAEHPALQRLRNITIHTTTHPEIICFSRHVEAWESPTGEADTVIVVISLNPHDQVEGLVTLDLGALGLGGASMGPGVPLMRVRDHLDGQDYTWGATNFVQLQPWGRLAHVFSVEAL
ncbi:alpha-1,4-glucan--maltose-1-phosphate maltosyltransferase [Nanchangia anserum]|uniref:Alpha-1,4-glucan:maltose-1-phosphate maltosyltransferase n=1 Tax=Nanchangia anserum TaxID=2692125 RepID=A0A8I0KQF1_9ACTO|nr:alpha-1,4-glucan--maltose-1-phosphate maltosyltransferase [Nanchangia anserum]MBD3689915.1 alpha-1,4-glucan--maltose-1-phosphate maltosyltransferase [Nanchangia anserum]QOX82269.1 alpha-1,4-glucan--maltose-1-phosphate maltosyltransferase [Nanchangia anserum]